MRRKTKVCVKNGQLCLGGACKPPGPITDIGYLLFSIFFVQNANMNYKYLLIFANSIDRKVHFTVIQKVGERETYRCSTYSLKVHTPGP